MQLRFVFINYTKVKRLVVNQSLISRDSKPNPTKMKHPSSRSYAEQKL